MSNATRKVYLLTSPNNEVSVYASLEALAADPQNGFKGTTAAIRAARKTAGGYPVIVKNYKVDSKPVIGNTELRNAALPQDVTQHLRPEIPHSVDNEVPQKGANRKGRRKNQDTDSGDMQNE